MKINLHIDQLVLEGIAIGPEHAGHIQSALESELMRLIAEGSLGVGMPSGGLAVGLRSTHMHLPHDRNPQELGRRITQAVYGGIVR